MVVMLVFCDDDRGHSESLQILSSTLKIFTQIRLYRRPMILGARQNQILVAESLPNAATAASHEHTTTFFHK